MPRITRGEFGMLSQRVEDNYRRLDAMDQGGTRGVALIAQQATELVKDVSDLRQEMRDHIKVHDDEHRTRMLTRRWVITTAIALMVVLETPLIYLVSVHG